jgi:thioredoxin reductase (NADPH)
VLTCNSKTGQEAIFQPDAAFIFIGQHPNSELVKDYVALDAYGYIMTGHDLLHRNGKKLIREPFAFETSVQGIFAAGDVRHGSVKQIASAVGEGAAASIAIKAFLKQE